MILKRSLSPKTVYREEWTNNYVLFLWISAGLFRAAVQVDLEELGGLSAPKGGVTVEEILNYHFIANNTSESNDVVCVFTCQEEVDEFIQWLSEEQKQSVPQRCPHCADPHLTEATTILLKTYRGKLPFRSEIPYALG